MGPAVGSLLELGLGQSRWEKRNVGEGAGPAASCGQHALRASDPPCPARRAQARPGLASAAGAHTGGAGAQGGRSPGQQT